MNIEIINENSIIIKFLLDDMEYKLLINNYDESIVYLKNLLESFIYLPNIDFHYVSSTNGPTQAIELSYSNEEKLIGILFCSVNDKKEVESFAKIIPMEIFNQELYLQKPLMFPNVPLAVLKSERILLQQRLWIKS